MKLVREHITFKRGIEPKVSMETDGLGKYSVYRELVKNKNKIPDILWLKDNPILTKALNFKGAKDLKNIVVFDEEEYSQDDFEGFLEDFRYDKIERDERQNVLLDISQINIGTIKNTGHKAILYWGSTKGFAARKEWLGINESLNFKRGVEPKDAMRTGFLKPGIIYASDIPKYSYCLWFINPKDNKIYKHYTYQSNRNAYEVNIEDLPSDLSPVNDLFSKPNSFSKFISKLHFKIEEAYNFQRGIDPKEAMNTGLDEYSLKRALINSPIQFLDNKLFLVGFDDWMQQNPNLCKALNYKNAEDAKYLLTFDVDEYCEEHDLDAEIFLEGFRSIRVIKAVSNEQVTIEEGVLNEDDSKVIYYYGGHINGFYARKEWLGINESYSFKRGIEPMDAMGTGDVAPRKFKAGRIRVKEAIDFLASEFNIKDKDVFDERPSNTAYQYKAWFKTTPIDYYSIEYRVFVTGEDAHFSHEELYARHERNSGLEVNRSPHEDEFCYDTLDSQTLKCAMDDIKSMVCGYHPELCIDEFEDLEPLDEKYNFKRGEEPKDAMGTADIYAIRARQAREEIEKLAKEYESESYLWTYSDYLAFGPIVAAYAFNKDGFAYVIKVTREDETGEFYVAQYYFPDENSFGTKDFDPCTTAEIAGNIIRNYIRKQEKEDKEEK